MSQAPPRRRVPSDPLIIALVGSRNAGSYSRCPCGGIKARRAKGCWECHCTKAPDPAVKPDNWRTHDRLRCDCEGCRDWRAEMREDGRGSR